MNEKESRVNNNKIEKFVVTSDDWHPNYDGNLVRVFIAKSPTLGYVKIVVCGVNDIGIELKIKGTVKELDEQFIAWKGEIYDKIPKPCTKKWFEDLGFKRI